MSIDLYSLNILTYYYNNIISPWALSFGTGVSRIFISCMNIEYMRKIWNKFLDFKKYPKEGHK